MAWGITSAAALKKMQWNFHAPVHRIDCDEDRTGEDDDAPTVLRCVVLKVTLHAQPQLKALVKFRGLRCGVGVTRRLINSLQS
jgi:hypothetical protein